MKDKATASKFSVAQSPFIARLFCTLSDSSLPGTSQSLRQQKILSCIVNPPFSPLALKTTE